MFEISIACVGVRRTFLTNPVKFLNFARIPALVGCVMLAACDSGPANDSDSHTQTTQQPSPLTFVGSDACSACHEDQWQAWQSSHHALAMLEATSDTVVGDFSGVDFSYFETISTFYTKDDNYYVRTENAAGEIEDFRIAYTFGVTPLQQYLVEMPRGHVQPLSVAWDDRAEKDGGQRWFHLYADEFIDHDDELHWTGRVQNWNYMCAECHSTNLQKNYDLESDSFATNWSEINVGCEGCHGPASMHVLNAESGSLSGDSGLLTDLDDAGRAVWQMNTQTGIAERSELRMRPPAQPEACGRCHARRSVLTSDYVYGKSLLDTHAPALLDENLYFPDGQIRDEVYVYGSFLQSRMYQAGVSCSDCHEPHSARLRTGADPSAICSTCHLPEKFAAESHHKHVETSVACVDCHMPQRVYMGVDDRRDHSFRIPRPDLSITAGTPNACMNCHAEQTADWALAAVQTWYGDTQDEHFATAIHAAQSDVAGANDLLVVAINNENYPGIARATALSLLRGPYSQSVAQTVQRSLASADPFVRIGALRALPSLQPELRAEWGGPLLADPVLAVRIEAVSVLSPVRSVLHLRYDAVFRAAEIEFLDSMHAIAERAEAHSMLGNHYAGSGDAATAEAEFRTALRLEPSAVGARVNLADLYRQLDRDADAEQVIRTGLELNADDPALRHSLGLLMVRSDRQSLALVELEAAAELQPENPRFAYVYGVALNSLGQTDASIVVLTTAAERFPADFDIHWGLTAILRDAGRSDEARDSAVGMLLRYPENESVQNLVLSLSGGPPN